MKEFLKKIVIAVLYAEAKIVLWYKKPQIIAITGTVGKTTTKDMVYAGVCEDCRVRKSPKGFNSDIGVLLTVLDLETHGASVFGWVKNIIRGVCCVWQRDYPELLVVEVGANYPGEIQKNARLLCADIVVFTRLPEIMAHMAFFDNRDHFVREKLSLAEHMNKNGVILYNGNDETLCEKMQTHFAQYIKKTFGKKCDSGFDAVTIAYDRDTIIGSDVVLHDQRTVHLQGVLGEHLGYPVAALLAVGDILGIAKEHVIASVQKNFTPPPGRMRVFEGINASTIIDDSYNALPESVHNGVKLLQKMHVCGRKIYVLGRMAELGDYTEASYKKAVDYIAEACDVICTVNDGGIAETYAQKKNFQSVHAFNAHGDDYFANTHDVGVFLRTYIQKGDIIIFKGARHSTGFEKAIKQLIKKEDVRYLIQEHL